MVRCEEADKTIRNNSTHIDQQLSIISNHRFKKRINTEIKQKKLFSLFEYFFNIIQYSDNNVI